MFALESLSRAHALTLESELFVMHSHFASTLVSGALSTCTSEQSYDEIVNNLHRIDCE